MNTDRVLGSWPTLVWYSHPPSPSPRHRPCAGAPRATARRRGRATRPAPPRPPPGCPRTGENAVESVTMEASARELERTRGSACAPSEARPLPLGACSQPPSRPPESPPHVAHPGTAVTAVSAALRRGAAQPTRDSRCQPRALAHCTTAPQTGTLAISNSGVSVCTNTYRGIAKVNIKL